MNEETRKIWSTSKLMVPIGYARELFLQVEETGSIFISSDIGIHMSK